MRLLLILLMITMPFQAQTFFQQEDKQMHFAAGSVIGATGYILSYNKHQDKKRAMITGICTAFAAGVAKEWLDANQGGYVEHEDVLATTLGGITFSLTIPLFQRKKIRYRQLDKVNGGYKY